MTRIERLAGALAAAQLVCPTPATAQSVKGPPVSEPRAGLAVPLWTPGTTPRADRRLRFVSIPKFFKKGRVQISKGTAVVNTRDWRAVAIAADSGNGPCTLTLIGPNVALLAAHCVDAGLEPNAPGLSTIPAEVSFDHRTYDLACEMSPAYRRARVNPMGSPRASDDFALCDVLSGREDRTALDEVSPESISLEIGLPAGALFQMMGYGCTNLGISDDGYYTYDKANGRLNMGPEKVESADVSIYPNTVGIYVRALSSDGGPTLCHGDSGGPVITAALTGLGRRIVAVNSAMGATASATVLSPSFHSYFSPLASPDFRNFIKAWVEQPAAQPSAKRKDRRICGFSIMPGSGGCRQ